MAGKDKSTLEYELHSTKKKVEYLLGEVENQRLLKEHFKKDNEGLKLQLEGIMRSLLQERENLQGRYLKCQDRLWVINDYIKQSHDKV